MSFIKFPNIGWIIVPKKQNVPNVLLNYLLDSKDFKNIYSNYILEDIDGKPDLEKINNKLNTSFNRLINYTGIRKYNYQSIVDKYNLKVLLTPEEFISMMNKSIDIFYLFNSDNTDDMPSWSLEKWLDYSGAEIIH